MRWRAALPFVAAVLIAVPVQAGRDALLQAGAYEVRMRLELPNVSRAAARTVTICLPHEDVNGLPFPVLSGNNPLARCAAHNIERDGATLRFDILCEGRGAAFANAVYRITPDSFEGRIAMVMGGKNMTMTEVQTGRRIGSCDALGRPPG